MSQGYHNPAELPGEDEARARKFLRRDLFSAKPYFNADYWIERLLKLIGLVVNDQKLRQAACKVNHEAD
jgi:hypothetical protein